MSNRIVNENRRDSSARKLLSNRSVVARLFRGIVPGFEDVPIEEIESYFGSELFLKGIGEVDPDTGLRYDLVFEARVPRNSSIVRIWINLEAQNDSRHIDLLSCRIVFYSANLVVMQKGRTFTGDNYNEMVDAYSIWILMDPPEWMRNCIKILDMSEKTIHGDGGHHFLTRSAQKAVVIGIGNPAEDDIPDYLRMIDWMMCEGFEMGERKVGLEELGITVTEDMAECIVRMNSIDEDRDRRMRAEGMDEGIALGRAEGLAEGRALGRAEGLAQARQEMVLIIADSIRSLMDYKGWTIEEVLARINIPENFRDDVILALSRSTGKFDRPVASIRRSQSSRPSHMFLRCPAM